MNAWQASKSLGAAVLTALSILLASGTQTSAGPMLPHEFLTESPAGAGNSYEKDLTLGVDQTSGTRSSDVRGTGIAFGDAHSASGAIAGIVGDRGSLSGGLMTDYGNLSGDHEGPAPGNLSYFGNRVSGNEKGTRSEQSITGHGKSIPPLSVVPTTGKGGLSTLTSPGFTAASVPEPSSLVLATIAGCFSVGLLARHRKATSG